MTRFAPIIPLPPLRGRAKFLLAGVTGATCYMVAVTAWNGVSAQTSESQSGRYQAEALFQEPSYSPEMHTLVTVPLDDGMEATVVLDTVTWTLTAYALDPLTRRFFAKYHYNQLARDFGMTRGSRPHFTIASGMPVFERFRSNRRLANGVVYVVEHRTGRLAAYGLEWNRSYRSYRPGGVRLRFVPLDAANFRFPRTVERDIDHWERQSDEEQW